MLTILDRLDHLVYATPDLEVTVREVGDLLGVTPSMGGRHPDWGTRNALLALGPRSYLEIVGPDFDNPRPPKQRPFRIDNLNRPRLVTWACRAEGLADLVQRARRLDVDLGEVREGSRRRPDGSTLSWIMTDPMMPREGGVIPFFIDWGGSAHPADQSVSGCSLGGFRAEHPDPERVKAVLRHLGLAGLEIDRGVDLGLSATVSGPRGSVELS